MTRAEARVCLDQSIGPAAPELHGHFVEQLFDCVNGGLYDAEAGEFRPFFVHKAAELGLELIRWPGGCFADAYHWRDGIGPRSQRPRTVTNRWGVDEVETHAVGSHEFMEFCRLAGAKPWINLNVATGTPREAAEWMEYLVKDEGTDLAGLRAAHGSPEPFAVDMWGVGNECWDCGGKFSPAEYAEAYRRFESALPRFPGLPRRLVAGGPDGNKPHEREAWTRDFLARLSQWRRPAIYAVDLHFYTWGDKEATGLSGQYSEDQFSALLSLGAELEPVLLRQREIIDAFDPGIKLLVGEWGPWHPDAHGSRFFQAVTVRDAVLASMTLDMFLRHADKVAAATYTMLCNVLGAPFQTIDGRPYTTPVYDVFRLHKPHRGGTSVRVEATSEDSWAGVPGLMQPVPGLSISATMHEGSAWVTASNLSPSMEARLDLAIPGAAGSAAGSLLSAGSILAHNGPDRMGVQMRDFVADGLDGRYSLVLPPAGMCGLRVQVPPAA